jgi:hypothetical protein
MIYTRDIVLASVMTGATAQFWPCAVADVGDCLVRPLTLSYTPLSPGALLVDA